MGDEKDGETKIKNQDELAPSILATAEQTAEITQERTNIT